VLSRLLFSLHVRDVDEQRISLPAVRVSRNPPQTLLHRCLPGQNLIAAGVLVVLLHLCKRARNDQGSHTFQIFCQTRGSAVDGVVDGCRHTRNTVLIAVLESDFAADL